VTNQPSRVKSLDEAAAFLKQQGVPDVMKVTSRTGSKVSLFAGSFAKDQRDAGDKLAARLKTMKLNGKLEFNQAQVVRVQQP